MSAARRMPRALLGMGTSLIVLTACSGSLPSSTVEAGACTGASPAELTAGGAGEVCADNGFHPSNDGFSFANWGGTPTDDAIDSGTLIAMFGREPVCANGSGDACTMRPAARAWMDQMNEALANGRCEGMAVLSERLFDGLANAAELDPRAQRTIDLARTQPNVARTLGYWWLTQFPAEVATPTSKSRSMPPSQMVSAVIDGLEKRAGNTLGLYSEFGGHAVTPIAVVKEGTNYTISVYDSNDPGVIKHVIVDPTTESWVYDAKSNAKGVVTERWRGQGAGSMDLTPMALRTGAFTAPFSDGPSADTYVTVTSPKDGANVGAVITRGNAVIDTRALGADLPPGVTVHRITGTGSGVEVIIAGDAGAMEVRAVSTGAAAMATVSLDSPGRPMVTARGRTGTVVSKALTLTRDARGAVAVESGTTGAVRTTIATETETVHLTAPTSTDVRVSPDPIPEASLVSQSGSTIATYDTAAVSSPAVGTTTLALNPQSDGFTVTRSLTVAEAPNASPVIEAAAESSPAASASASATRERKDRPETEHGKRVPRPSKPASDRPAEPTASPAVSASASPSRARGPEKQHESNGTAGHARADETTAPSPTATPSASASASASPSATASESVSASASALPTAPASPTESVAAAQSASSSTTPAPSSTKKNESKRDKPKKQDD